MIITHNMSVMTGARYGKINNIKKTKALERLSSGYKLNRAADNAAGLCISEKMRSNIRGLETAALNIQDGISLIQVADGALNEVHSVLQRMRELSVQAGNDTNTFNDRKSISEEIEQLKEEIDRIGGDTEFNTMKLFNGSIGTGGKIETTEVNIQEGSAIRPASVSMAVDFGKIKDGSTVEISDGTNTYKFEFDSDGTVEDASAATISITSSDTGEKKADALRLAIEGTGKFSVMHFRKDGDKRVVMYTSKSNVPGQKLSIDYHGGKGSALNLQVGPGSGQKISLSVEEVSTAALGIQDIKVNTHEAAGNSIKKLDTAINSVSGMRSGLGAAQNRLEHAFAFALIYEENLADTESRLRDTEMAGEMIRYSRQNILEQAGQSMMSQSMKNTEQVLQLLQK